MVTFSMEKVLCFLLNDWSVTLNCILFIDITRQVHVSRLRIKFCWEMWGSKKLLHYSCYYSKKTTIACIFCRSIDNLSFHYFVFVFLQVGLCSELSLKNSLKLDGFMWKIILRSSEHRSIDF